MAEPKGGDRQNKSGSTTVLPARGPSIRDNTSGQWPEIQGVTTTPPPRACESAPFDGSWRVCECAGCEEPMASLFSPTGVRILTEIACKVNGRPYCKRCNEAGNTLSAWGVEGQETEEDLIRRVASRQTGPYSRGSVTSSHEEKEDQ
jgi:hypothetical protein